MIFYGNIYDIIIGQSMEQNPHQVYTLSGDCKNAVVEKKKYFFLITASVNQQGIYDKHILLFLNQ